MLEAAKTAHDATLHYIRTPVGRLATPLHTYLALIADDPTVQLVNEAQRAYAASARGCARRPRLAADSFSGGAVQMRRAQRTLCLYGHRRGAARDQGRGGHLPVPQQSEGG